MKTALAIFSESKTKIKNVSVWERDYKGRDVLRINLQKKKMGVSALKNECQRVPFLF